MADIVIVGGGLAGLFNALVLNRAGYSVTLIEKKQYPFHRVCGEYISNEVIPFLNSLDINVADFGAAKITQLEITSASGKKLSQKLDIGGFGLSRYTFDHFLYQKALAEGVTFLLNTRVEDIIFKDGDFRIITPTQTLNAPIVIGSFGKRSNLDQKLKRNFFYKRSPYIGVKYHIKTDFPENLIQLNNYKNGYCGIVKIEEDKCCMCYLAHRDDLKEYGSIPELEQQLLWKNPYLKQVFQQADFLWDKPEVINEISFEKKDPVDQNILMSGDTAGMIVPLCGNGMSMAIHSAKLLSKNIINFYTPGNFTPAKRLMLEQAYTKQWNSQFASRLWTGRQIQKLFGRDTTTDRAIQILKISPSIANYLINKTHGEQF